MRQSDGQRTLHVGHPDATRGAKTIYRSLRSASSMLSLQSLPKDMVFSMAHDPSLFRMIWVPSEPTPETEEGGLPRQSVRGSSPGLRRADRGRVHNAHPSPTEAKRRCPRPIESPRVSGKASPAAASQVARPDLCFVNGFTGEYTNMLLRVPNSDEILFAAGSLVVAMNSTKRVFDHSPSAICVSQERSNSASSSGTPGGSVA